MNSRLLYTSTDFLKIKVDWFRSNNSEWIYFGQESDFDIDFVIDKIKKCFNNQELFPVLGRENSGKLNSDDLKKELFNKLGKEDFFIWNSDFDKVMEFNKIGVLRIGIVWSIPNNQG